MTELGDEVRRFTSSNKLHPLVAQNLASASGLCMCSVPLPDGGRAWCMLDYGHPGIHQNGAAGWRAPWPEPR
jgi:hypothetical protein